MVGNGGEKEAVYEERGRKVAFYEEGKGKNCRKIIHLIEINSSQQNSHFEPVLSIFCMIVFFCKKIVRE